MLVLPEDWDLTRADPDCVHGVITAAVAMNLPHVFNAYAAEWKYDAFWEVYFPPPVSLCTDPKILDLLFAHASTAKFFSTAEWRNLHYAWLYASARGNHHAAAKIASRHDPAQCTLWDRNAKDILVETIRCLVVGQNSQLLADILKAARNTERHVRAVRLILDYAAEYGKNEIAAMVLEHFDANRALLGCQVTFRSLLSKAASNGHDQIVRLLRGRCGVGRKKSHPLVEAACGGFVRAGSALLEPEAADICPTAEQYHRAFWAATRNGHAEFLEVLLQHRSVAPKARKKWMPRLISLASLQGHDSLVRRLYEEVPDEKVEDSGETCRHGISRSKPVYCCREESSASP